MKLTISIEISKSPTLEKIIDEIRKNSKTNFRIRSKGSMRELIRELGLVKSEVRK